MNLKRVILRNPTRTVFDVLTPSTWQNLVEDDEIVIQELKDGKWVDAAYYPIPPTWKFAILGVGGITH